MAAGLGGDGQPVRYRKLVRQSMAAEPVWAMGCQRGWNVAASTCTHHTVTK